MTDVGTDERTVNMCEPGEHAMLAVVHDKYDCGVNCKHESLSSEPSVTYSTAPGGQSTDAVAEAEAVTVRDGLGDAVNVAVLV